MASSSSTSTDFEHFNSKLYSEVSKQNHGQSIFLSPASISLAVSMCAAGARNETLRQMTQVLGASSIKQLINTAEQIMSVFALADRDREVQLKLANRLYAQKNYKLQQEYVSLVQKSFQADMQLEDFEHHSEQVVRTINTWVETQTKSLIRDLLAASDVTSDTRLILVNCIYFKGAWLNTFEEHLTNQRANFYEGNGEISKIQLMHQTEMFPYYENKNLGVRVVHLPYQHRSSGVQFVFTVILPDPNASFAEVERKLMADATLMRQVLSYRGATSKNVELYLPKFKMETKFQLNDVLRQLGMPNAFDGLAADFTGMVRSEDARQGLYISQVIHKAFIGVDEQGSEAAAATAMILMTECCQVVETQQVLEFKVDRPFLFAIQESYRGLTLFQGKFLSPNH